MTFESLFISDFGKLSNISLSLSGGLNIIEGVNESGKSTVCAFLQFMFYGLSGRADEKLRYIRWQSARAGGSLTFSDGGKRYRIEREAICVSGADGKNVFREKCAVYDAETNLPVLKGSSPGEAFFGVSEEVFASTVYIRQCADSKIGGASLGEEAENILFSGNESINTQKAIEKLDAARVFLRHKNRRGGKISELETERDAVEARLAEAKTASGDIIYLEGTERQLTEKLAEANARLEAVDAELAQYERYTIKRAYLRRKQDKARLADTEARLADCHAPEAHGGIDIGTDAYIAALEARRRETEAGAARYAEAEKAMTDADRKLTDLSEKLDLFKRFGARSGGKTRAELMERLRSAHQTLQGLRTRKAVCFLLAAVFAVLAGVLFFSLPTVGVPFYAVLALVPTALLLGVIFLLQEGKPKKETAEICGQFGCRTYSEFEELIRASSEDEAYMLFVTAARDEAADRFAEASEALEAQSREILTSLGRDGFAASDNTASSLENALAECREMKSEIARLETLRDEQRRRIEEVEETLAAYPKDYLRDACTAEYDETAMEAFQLVAKRRDRDFVAGSITAMTEKLHKTEVELSALHAVSVHPTELAEEKNALDAEIEHLTQKWEAYRLAIETMEAASGKLREGISPKIAASAGKIMGALTDGKYNRIGVDLDFGLSFSAGEQMRDASYLSAGTGDLAYLCLRIALIELLYRKSVPPFLFDESFVRMDDTRLFGVLQLLSKYADRKLQSILFTCHTREKTLMKKIGECHVLTLPSA